LIKRKPDPIAKLLSFLLDSIALSSVWVMSFYLRFFTLISSPKGIPNPIAYYKLIPFIVLCWAFVVTLDFFGKKSFQNNYFKLVCEVLLLSGLFICLSYFYNEYRYSRLTLLLFCVLSPFALLITRWMSSFVFYDRKSFRNILLISDNEDSINLDNILLFLKKDCTKLILDSSKLSCKEIQSKHILKLSEKKIWQEYLSKKYYTSAIICISYNNYKFINLLLNVLVNEIADIHIVSDMSHLGGFNRVVENFGDLSIVTINDSPLKGGAVVCKRLFDIILSLTMIIVLSPVFLIISLLLSKKSYDSIFFRQKRMGLDGSTFTMFKFRSMTKENNNIENQSWTTADDTRVTQVGKFLRKFSLDELPQLFNVLRGDMSLVGPRPEVPFFVNEFRKEIPGYMLRHKVKSGVTGWAQINGLRGDTSIKKRIDCDLYYIKNWSLGFDCIILIKTLIQEIFSPKGK
jgi:exopolysaccharide biosynthesis polyprenyl glycosylphosphotransferase